MFDVAIIGCGPVGALAANLLGKAGLKTLVVERELDRFPLPRAVHLDHEMMRLFQSAGVIDRVAGDMRDTDGHLHVGADHGVIRYMGTIGRPRPFGWSNDYFFYQPELEDHLREALGAYPNVDLRLGTELEGLRQDGDKVTISLVTGGQAHEAEARYVIGCDGSRSAVRKQLGIRLDDLEFEEPWLVVDAEVDGQVQFPDVTGVPPGANLQKLSVMMCDPRRPATVVPGRGNHRRWEFMLLPSEDDQEMMRPEKVAELVGPYLDGVPHRIVRAATYRFHGLIAETWQDGRVFLAGDAAHQTPPFFGQGMCHGLRDVANLAWKLKLVLTGKAGGELLATYQLERDPHVRAVISAAVEAGRYICMLDVDEAAARDAAMREKAKGRDPATAADLIPAIASGIVADGTPVAGERFIQPRVRAEGGEALLDEVTGGGWRLFVIGDPIEDDDEVKAFDARSFEPLGNWLRDHRVSSVLVRPDHYVFGAGNDPAALLKERRRKIDKPFGQSAMETVHAHA